MRDIQHVELVSANGDSRVVVSTWGGRVISWKYRGRELLYQSAIFEADETLSPHAGMPVLFPQFGLFGDGNMHGFVRNMNWRTEAATSDQCVLVLTPNEFESNDPAVEFAAQVTAQLDDDRLRVWLQFDNASESNVLTFTTGLHTYIAVDDIGGVQITGLQGANFLEAADELSPSVDLDVRLRFDLPVDRVYVGTPTPITMVAEAIKIVVDQTGFEDTVIWNPGSEHGPNCDSLERHEWRKFVCIEAAQIQNPVTLKPGESWTGSQTLTVR